VLLNTVDQFGANHPCIFRIVCKHSISALFNSPSWLILFASLGDKLPYKNCALICRMFFL
jgi:hypothetical protein